MNALEDAWTLLMGGSACVLVALHSEGKLMFAVLAPTRAFVLAHPDLILFALLWGATGLVSMVPPRWRNVWAVGVLVRLLARLSWLSHHSAPGTLKWPGVGDLVLNAAKDVATDRDRPPAEQPAPPPERGEPGYVNLGWVQMFYLALYLGGLLAMLRFAR